MIPIRDAVPSLTRPMITWAIIAASIGMFFLVQPQTAPDDVEFLYEAATIPCEVTTGSPLDIEEIERDQCSEAALGQPLFSSKNIALSVVTSIFLHGGLGHLIGNMWVLFIFGNNVEDAMGKGAYLVFYLVAGVVATFAHILLNPESTIPVIGASGAIAGVMGAYLVLYPGARVVSVFPILFFIPLAVPAVIFLGVWFVSQFVLVGQESGIAWEAHVGGFLFGLAVAGLLRRRLLERISQHRLRARQIRLLPPGSVPPRQG